MLKGVYPSEHSSLKLENDSKKGLSVSYDTIPDCIWKNFDHINFLCIFQHKTTESEKCFGVEEESSTSKERSKGKHSTKPVEDVIKQPKHELIVSAPKTEQKVTITPSKTTSGPNVEKQKIVYNEKFILILCCIGGLSVILICILLLVLYFKENNM